ncbi:DNA ligase D [Anaerotignum sp. MB30-C6]|uniref:DNA ligase D n=1 Tax=Anaerotignum sp. MB30-C6 TaxID=3070814 RepID=UPI0027DDB71B|nr:DNA ligase D [Anaerotignum sp. MB30-C6]WMI79894.1 DNA ligase D [Anaerotignum sp. MB30-C6]
MDKKLWEYQDKRNFTKTLEPKGETASNEESLSFVVQHHLARRDHYDFRLEWAGVLLSWAVPKGPSYDTHDKRLAIHVEDHPLDYKNFEGTIPKGEYGGGIVMLWDEGEWEPYGNVEEGIHKGELKFILKGKRLQGKWAMIRLKGKPDETKENWLFLKERDEFCKTSDGISQFITSIRTGRTMEEIETDAEKKFTPNPFQTCDVQLAQLVNKVPEGEGWIYEMKYDGYRIMAFVEGNSARLITRNGNDYQKRFRDIALSISGWANGRPMVLDGEMVITDASGKTDFQALQNYLKNSKSQKLTYILFDILALDGEDLREQTLLKRKEILEALMKDAPNNLYYSRYVKGQGEESFSVACQAGMEGIIGKKIDSIYSGTRNGDWIKLKCDKRQEFVIGGYTLSDKKAWGVSSLLLGVYEGENLIYTGRAGTGMSENDMKFLEKEFNNIKKADSPFLLPPKSKATEKITWLEPVLVAEIKFAEWTKENLLRQASFKGLRTDKDAKNIKKEKTGNEISSEPSETEGEKAMGDKNSVIIGGVKISNPDKVIYDEPVITKADVVRYYEGVSSRMLPYLSHRVLTAVRCPKGISQTCFYKKHPAADSKEIITIPISNSKGEVEEYFYIETVKGILSEVQMGTLEFHTWGSTVDTLEKPDMMVFDLDPDEGMELDQVRQGVEDVRSILNELSLNSYLKTSGGKGYHVVVPLKPIANWDAFHDFAKGVAEVMEQKWPDRYTSNVRKANRKGRIFIDWIRNGRGATSVAPYSLRGRKGAAVSMPIPWEELHTVTPDGINMTEALMRVKGDDPWKGFFQNNQMLK